jgi:tetratricopeptide (TPR) repeat protein
MLEQPIFSIEALPVLPPAVLHGRQSELLALRENVKTGKVTWLNGLPGSGRRALAATIAAEVVTKSGGVLWLGAYYDNLLTLAGRFSRAYGVSALSTDDIASQLEIVQALLEQNKPLVVLDGQIASSVVTQFMLRIRLHDLPVIITGSPYREGEWEQIQLLKLKDKDSESLYRMYAQVAPEATRSALIAPLLNYVEGHPLSLYVAGAQVREMKMATSHFTSLLPETPNGAQNRALGVYATAYSQLDSRAQGVFLLCGALFVDRIGLSLLSAISGASFKTLQPYMQILVQRGFCTEIKQLDRPPVYRFHDLARVFARQMLKARHQLEETYTRILKGIYQFIETHTEEPSDEHFDALAREMDHILGAAQFATSIQDRETVKAIFKMLGQHGNHNVIHARGYHAFYERLGQLLAGKPVNYDDELAQITQAASFAQKKQADARIVKSSDPKPLPSSIQQPRVRIAIEQMRSMSREALQAALNEATTAQDDEQAAQLSIALGDWFSKQRQDASALSNYRVAVKLYEKLGDEEELLNSLHAVITVSLRLNRASEAISDLNRAIVLAEKQHDQVQHGKLLTLLGDAQSAIGTPNEATQSYSKAAEVLQTIPDWINAGIALVKKAALLMDIVQLEAATITFAQAAELFERGERRDLQGRALGNLGTAFGRLGRYREAGQRHMLAMKIARETTDIEEERHQLVNLSYVAEAEGLVEWAIYYGRQALYLALVASDRDAVAQITLNLGRLLLSDPHQLMQAIVLLQHAIDMATLPEAIQLLEHAKIRRQRLVASRQYIPPAETDLLKYTQEAYQSS